MYRSDPSMLLRCCCCCLSPAIRHRPRILDAYDRPRMLMPTGKLHTRRAFTSICVRASDCVDARTAALRLCLSLATACRLFVFDKISVRRFTCARCSCPLRNEHAGGRVSRRRIRRRSSGGHGTGQRARLLAAVEAGHLRHELPLIFQC